MSCLPAGSLTEGQACKNVSDTPECGEDLVCLRATGSEEGVCSYFCGVERECRIGLVCGKVRTAAARTFFACIEPTE
jgi:hypothetical protein